MADKLRHALESGEVLQLHINELSPEHFNQVKAEYEQRNRTKVTDDELITIYGSTIFFENKGAAI